MALGAYIHIPFCNGKCPYCDFYSMNGDAQLKESYTKALICEIEDYKGKSLVCDTLYFGGGTPLELGAERLCRVIEKAKEVFGKPKELTVEVNPGSSLAHAFSALAKSGVNRISIGMQSAVDSELKALGRKHTSEQVRTAVLEARAAGIDNISLDIMLGIPLQTAQSLEYTVEFAAQLKVQHLSAYLLKIEEGTPFYQRRETLGYANDDQMANFYEQMCTLAKRFGYDHYEISNFARKGFESAHNLKYWRCEEYLGIGCSAHSFFEGRRFFYPRDIKGYIDGQVLPIDDGEGGSFEDYLMLGLRLFEGISEKQCKERFGVEFSPHMMANIKMLCANGLAHYDGDSLALTEKGFLLSNEIIAMLLK